MDKRRILRLFLLPALAGMAASLLAYGYLKAAEGPVAGKRATVPVVVAKKPIEARTRLQADMLTVQRVPQEFAWRGSLASVDQAAGRVTAVPLAAGEPVLKSALALAEDKSALAFHVPPGFRAVTIAVNELTGVAGRLQVGDRVDLVGTFAKDVAGESKAILLMEDIKVLALGRADATDMKDKATGGYRSVTVAVKPEQAVLLALAAERGHVQAILRPVDGEEQRGRLVATEQSFRQ